MLIKPIQLPNGEIKLKKKTKCHVAGWGFTRSHGEKVNDLQEVEVPIISLEKCQEMWRNILPANVICAGGYETVKGFCQVCFHHRKCQLVCSVNILNNE